MVFKKEHKWFYKKVLTFLFLYIRVCKMLLFIIDSSLHGIYIKPFRFVRRPLVFLETNDVKRQMA